MEIDETTTDTPPKTPPLNARFENQLPEIIRQICATLMQVRGPLNEVTVRVRELHDYIRFEIEKAKLEATKNALTEVVDPGQLTADEIWISRLEYIVSEFDPQHATSSVAFLTELKRELEDTFNLPPPST